MAFAPAPTGWLGAEYSADADEMTLPIDNFPQLTAAEADEATGDIRKILFALLDKAADKFESLPIADRPAKMTIQRGYGSIAGGITRVTFSLSFSLAVGSVEVASE